MRGELVGSLVGAVFGLVFVVVNTGSLPASAAVLLRAAAVVAFVAVLVEVLRGRDRPPQVRPHGRGFGRGYWLVVVAEVCALVVGVRVLSGPLDAPHAGVAWVSFVVGVHFFALAVVFAEPFFHRLGAAITACGLVGLVLAAGGAAAAPIDVVSGVVPGAVLLGAGWWGARRTAQPAEMEVHGAR